MKQVPIDAMDVALRRYVDRHHPTLGPCNECGCISGGHIGECLVGLAHKYLETKALDSLAEHDAPKGPTVSMVLTGDMDNAGNWHAAGQSEIWPSSRGYRESFILKATMPIPQEPEPQTIAAEVVKGEKP